MRKRISEEARDRPRLLPHHETHKSSVGSPLTRSVEAISGVVKISAVQGPSDHVPLPHTRESQWPPSPTAYFKCRLLHQASLFPLARSNLCAYWSPCHGFNCVSWSPGESGRNSRNSLMRGWKAGRVLEELLFHLSETLESCLQFHLKREKLWNHNCIMKYQYYLVISPW